MIKSLIWVFFFLIPCRFYGEMSFSAISVVFLSFTRQVESHSISVRCILRFAVRWRTTVLSRHSYKSWNPLKICNSVQLLLLLLTLSTILALGKVILFDFSDNFSDIWPNFWNRISLKPSKPFLWSKWMYLENFWPFSLHKISLFKNFLKAQLSLKGKTVYFYFFYTKTQTYWRFIEKIK